MRTILQKNFISLFLIFIPMFGFSQFIANYHKAGDADIHPTFPLVDTQETNPLGSPENLTALHFELNKYSLTPEMKESLNTLVSILNENPDIKVEVAAHSDSRGSANYNFALTQKRSKSVSKYLISKGISKERFVLKSYGETELLYKCDDTIVCTDAMQKENRRVEFRIFYPIKNTFGSISE